LRALPDAYNYTKSKEAPFGFPPERGYFVWPLLKVFMIEHQMSVAGQHFNLEERGG
jgi:hypothetical protein